MRFRVLGSGSSGNATLVEAAGERLLIDAGLGSRDLAERLLSAGVDPASLSGILLSHEHGDHARGAAAFSRKWGVPVLGSRGTYAACGFGGSGGAVIPQTHEARRIDSAAPDAPIAGYTVLLPMTLRAVGAFSVTAVPVPHDALAPFAFVVTADGANLGHATDLGHVSGTLAAAFRACDGVLLEANYDLGLLHGGPYPWSVKERIAGAYGHLSNDDVALYVRRGLGDRCRTLVLAHLSETNNRPELALAAVEMALRAGGRTEVAVAMCTPEGTGWAEVTASPSATPGRPCQLRLW